MPVGCGAPAWHTRGGGWQTVSAQCQLPTRMKHQERCQCVASLPMAQPGRGSRAESRSCPRPGWEDAVQKVPPGSAVEALQVVVGQVSPVCAVPPLPVAGGGMQGAQQHWAAWSFCRQLHKARGGPAVGEVEEGSGTFGACSRLHSAGGGLGGRCSCRAVACSASTSGTS